MRGKKGGRGDGTGQSGALGEVRAGYWVHAAGRSFSRYGAVYSPLLQALWAGVSCPCAVRCALRAGYLCYAGTDTHAGRVRGCGLRLGQGRTGRGGGGIGCAAASEDPGCQASRCLLVQVVGSLPWEADVRLFSPPWWAVLVCSLPLVWLLGAAAACCALAVAGPVLLPLGLALVRVRGRAGACVLNLVISEPWRMKQVMNRASKRLDSPECRYLTYCYLRLSELVKENEKKKARAVAKDRESKLRGRLVVAELLPKDVGDLTVEHLGKATRGWRQREPDLVDFLRLNVNREQLMNQLEDWVDTDNVC